jgi:peptide/nickel transport system ATP-binding protein
MSALLEIEALRLRIGGGDILRGVDLKIDAGEVVALVGESGSGKSMTGFSVLRLTPPGAVLSGVIRFDGGDLLRLSEAEMCRRRGREIGFVFQEPMSALNPLMTIGAQVAEAAQRGLKLDAQTARMAASTALARVGLAPEAVGLERYPHELSGGQRQRVAIAIATVCRPKLLIADEPTTALDVTTQAQILALLRNLCRSESMALVFITHDLAVAASLADRIAVMQTGQIVEVGARADVLGAPQHPYTQSLLAAARYRPARRTTELGAVALAAEKLDVAYSSGSARVHAVKAVSLAVASGEIVAIVGESGSGKSTLARAVLGLLAPDAGAVRIAGADPWRVKGAPARAMRRTVQAVFQDPYGSFNPRWPVGRIIAEPLGLLDPEPDDFTKSQRVSELLRQVGLASDAASEFPHAFSGGQRQRIAIARALATEPGALVLDEPLSALDVSIRAQILELLATIAARRNLAILFITHDLGLVRGFADRVVVMRAGEIVEQGAAEAVFAAPAHPYTASLLAATPAMPASLGEGAA